MSSYEHFFTMIIIISVAKFTEDTIICHLMALKDLITVQPQNIDKYLLIVI